MEVSRVAFCVLCNVSFLSHQENEHNSRAKHGNNELEEYKSNFHSIPVSRRRRSLRSTSLLKIFTDREMVALSQY
jgi:hypothetical protein